MSTKQRLTLGLDSTTQATHPKFVLHLSTAIETYPTACLVWRRGGTTSVAGEGQGLIDKRTAFACPRQRHRIWPNSCGYLGVEGRGAWCIGGIRIL